MGGACDTVGRGEVHKGFWWRNLRERYYLGDTGVDGRIILKLIWKKWGGGHGLDVVLVNAVMNLRVP
jgi:hypothetical protein